MSGTEIATIDAEYSVIPHNPAGPMGTLETASTLVQWMTKNANTPAYISNIQGKQYPKVEWWTAAGAALGLFPFEVDCRRHDRGDGAFVYEATVEVRRGATTIGRASAICSTDEKRWGHADEYAVRSMAITRATGKAYRIGLSFLAVMSGLEATPAEEIPPGGFDSKPAGQSPPRTPAKEVRRPPAPAAHKDVGQGGIYVANVETYQGETNGKPWTKYTVEFSDGTRASTFDETLASLAESCMDQSKPVDPELQQKGKFTNLVGLTELDGPVAPGPVAPAGEPDNPVEVMVNKVEQHNNSQGGVNYIAHTDAGIFGTSDAELGTSLFGLDGKMANIEWADAGNGRRKIIRLLDMEEVPF